VPFFRPLPLDPEAPLPPTGKAHFFPGLPRRPLSTQLLPAFPRCSPAGGALRFLLFQRVIPRRSPIFLHAVLHFFSLFESSFFYAEGLFFPSHRESYFSPLASPKRPLPSLSSSQSLSGTAFFGAKQPRCEAPLPLLARFERRPFFLRNWLPTADRFLSTSGLFPWSLKQRRQNLSFSTSFTRRTHTTPPPHAVRNRNSPLSFPPHSLLGVFFWEDFTWPSRFQLVFILCVFPGLGGPRLL